MGLENLAVPEYRVGAPQPAPGLLYHVGGVRIELEPGLAILSNRIISLSMLSAQGQVRGDEELHDGLS